MKTGKLRLVIGNRNYSSWSLRAWFLLAAQELEFDVIRVPLSVASSALELRKYSPAARVPVLLDGEAVIWDSLSICEYVSERYLDNRGWPVDILQRAEARSCCAEMHSGFFLLRERMPMNCRAEGRRVEIDEDLNMEIQRILSMWEGLRENYASAGPWLFGEFSIADCMYAPVVMRFHTYDVDVNDMVEAYMETVLSHPKIEYWLQQARKETETIECEEVGI